jgi:7,8-dihydroneopterin aldolase/epimerase/oxygenase
LTDTIKLHGLRFQARVGVTPEERAEPRLVRVDAELAVDLHKAGESDDLEHTVDYSQVVELIERVVTGTEAKLLEHLADRIVAAISPISGVERVTVEVAKKAPISQEHDWVSVRVERP